MTSGIKYIHVFIHILYNTAKEPILSQSPTAPC